MTTSTTLQIAISFLVIRKWDCYLSCTVLVSRSVNKNRAIIRNFTHTIVLSRESSNWTVTTRETSPLEHDENTIWAPRRLRFDVFLCTSFSVYSVISFTPVGNRFQTLFVQRQPLYRIVSASSIASQFFLGKRTENWYTKRSPISPSPPVAWTAHEKISMGS